MSDVFPQVIVEAGFEPTTPGLATGDLLLDDPTYGLLDTGKLGDTNTWTDISGWCQSGSISRLFTRQQGPLTLYQGGTATFTFNNTDGRFDPENLSGPYVSAGVTQVRPMIPVRMRAVYAGVTYDLFSGFATSWIPPGTNFGPRYDQTVLSAADAFRVFTGVNLAAAGAAGANELSGARISRILTAAGWYASARGLSVIAAGDSRMQATTLGADALSLMQLTTDSELGELYMDGQGRVVFRNRHAILTGTRSNTPQAVFGDSLGTVHSAGTELPYSLLSRPDDDTTMANDIQATIVGGTLQVATDAASVAKYLFARTYARADLILTTDAEALNWAQYTGYLAAGDESRFDEMTISPRRQPADLFPQALGRELGDRIQVWRRPPGVSAISKDLFIRGIAHTFDASAESWQTVWATQSAARYSFLTLDNTTLGQLDASALAY